MSSLRSPVGARSPAVASGLRGWAGLMLSLVMLGALTAAPARASDEAMEAGAAALRSGRFDAAVASFEAAAASCDDSSVERRLRQQAIQCVIKT